jgi:outer membrane protein assembly factor BamB
LGLSDAPVSRLFAAHPKGAIRDCLLRTVVPVDFIWQARFSHRLFVLLAACGAVGTAGVRLSWAQLAGPGVVPGTEFELSDAVTLNRAETTVRTYVNRVRQYVADQDWDQAVETLRRVMEESGEKMIEVSPSRHISVRAYCQLQLTALPPEGLALYRSQVDPVARTWYQQGITERDPALLLRVVNQTLASSWGDDALYALGEMALEDGDCAAARAYWEKIIPVEPPPGVADTWLSVPDTELDLASVRARLVLASILEGSVRRAEKELTRLQELHPDAKGKLGGSAVAYSESLATLLAESKSWPDPVPTGDWPTFAGSPQRNTVAPQPSEPSSVVWRVPLRETTQASVSAAATARVAELAETPLSYHPVTLGDLVLINNDREILALNVRNGKPAWGQGIAEVYRDRYEREAYGLRALPRPNLGLPRYTMTAHGGRLYARMGPPMTSRPHDRSFRGKLGHLVCLDLEAEGRLVWRIEPEEAPLAFDGAPVTDGTSVYVAVRRSDIQPQVHVACYDASSGRQRWRRFVCSAETPARGMLFETTHNLLTLNRDTLYLNTNMGAVAALSARDGKLKWITMYPRSRKGNLVTPDPHRSRDLTPCLYDRGVLLVAPTDSPRITALDAVTGQILWHTGPEVEDVVHLLGVADDHLIASGHRLYWIGLGPEDAGRVMRVVPDSQEKLGYGRGILAGDCVYWPTRETTYVFDRSTGRQKKEIPLGPRGVRSGNLVVGGGKLLIAGTDELVALGPQRALPEDKEERLARWLKSKTIE